MRTTASKRKQLTVPTIRPFGTILFPFSFFSSFIVFEFELPDLDGIALDGAFFLQGIVDAHAI